MQTSLVMTVIGPDRPGLVEAVARLVAAHGGNWLESRMARLGGQFAGILRIELPAERQNQLMAELKALSSEGLSVVASPDRPAGTAGHTRKLVIELVGQDRPGIVREIAAALAAHGVNVEELQTECASAPMSGEPLFKAKALLSAPAACNINRLRAELEKIAADLIVDISLGEMLAGKPSVWS